MYEGFEEYLSGKGQKTVYKSPAETTVAAQVQMLDELITQKVASITISTNGDAGYDEVFKKAKRPEYRLYPWTQKQARIIEYAM